MSEEKIKIPIYTPGELNAIDNAIMTNFDNLVNTAIEHIYKDRECIALQKIIKEQQKEIEELTKQLEKEKEKNKEYENKIKAVLELIDTKPYTAYTLYGDILYDDENIRELLEERN